MQRATNCLANTGAALCCALGTSARSLQAIPPAPPPVPCVRRPQVMHHPKLGHGGILLEPAWQAEFVAALRELLVVPQRQR